jgi:hypothetical protein
MQYLSENMKGDLEVGDKIILKLMLKKDDVRLPLKPKPQ